MLLNNHSVGKVLTKLPECHFKKKTKVGIHKDTKGSILETTRNKDWRQNPAKQMLGILAAQGTRVQVIGLLFRVRPAIPGVWEHLAGRVGCWSQVQTGTQLLNLGLKIK